MKSISLLLLRLSTGIYLVLWGIVKLAATDMANSVSDRYYSGIIITRVSPVGGGGRARAGRHLRRRADEHFLQRARARVIGRAFGNPVFHASGGERL